MRVALWIVQGFLAFAFFAAGGMKLAMPLPDLAANGVAVADRAPELLVRFIGLSEVLGALGLVLPSALRIQPRLTPLAAGGLALVMLLAAVEHLMNGEAGAVPVTVVLGGLAVFVAWGRTVKEPIAPRE